MNEIKEDDLQVKYGMYDFRLDEKPAIHSLTYIFNDIHDIKQSYFKLGFHLNEFNQFRYYENLGFLSFKEFCEANLPIDMSAVKRCIQVFRMTCQYNSNVPTMFMDDKYKPYGYSQLCEMVAFKDEKKRDMVKPDMTIKQIRELKKNISGAPIGVDSKRCDVAPRTDDSIIDDELLTIELVDMIKKKYKASDITQLSHTGRCIWFQSGGKQYKILLSISKLKEEESDND